jgi:hypothetical protein
MHYIRSDSAAARRATSAAATAPGSWLNAQSMSLASAILVALSIALLPAAARSEGAGIIAPGDAVVTGFSGIVAPDAPLAPGADPLDQFHIDLDGPSAQIKRLGIPGGPPVGQLISPEAPYKVKARDVGQVFGIALDDGRVPNIYLTATAAFGLRIVGADADGDGRPDRLKTGQPGAEWMPGQFGDGGPGAIYRIDGETGEVSLFATIPDNSGAGLGNIVFDRASRHFFVSDFDSGLIHRIDAQGELVDSFDHGTTGRAAAGLDEIADDGSAIDLTSPAFDTEKPETWALTQPERRVWGLAVHRGRLFYSIADGPAVWSVGIGPDGSFAEDARLEIEIIGELAGRAISDIVFDGQGRMYLAQRGEMRGSYDYSVFAEPERSAVLRYVRQDTDDPSEPGAWIQEEYAIGLPPAHRNASGGIALGYGHDKSGMARRGICNQTLWSTGDNLRNNAALADQLGDEGPLDIHGLQGNDVSLVRPQNVPPTHSYFIDYDGQFGDTEKAGHVGDVEIWQPCEGSPEFGGLFPGYPPLGYLPPDDDVPPGKRRTNLRLDKRAVACWKIAGNKHRCGYIITVTNTGPHTYNSHIRVRDRIPAGTTAMFSSPLFNCGFGPPNYTCQSNAPIVLHPWEKVTIPVRVDVPDNLAKPLNCRVRNRARIVFAPGGSPRNIDPSDDADAATAHLPAHLCKDPPKERTNLKITKRPLACFRIQGGKIRCGYQVRVWNMGPGDYHDKIEVNESIPVGATPHFSGAPAVGWNCVGGNPYTCTSNPVFLSPAQNVVLNVRLDITQEQARQWDCKLRNTARLTYAPGGSSQNTNPADDAASAVATIPDELCYGRTNLKLIKGLYAASDCPLTGNATWCKKFRIVVWNTGPGTFNGPIKVRELLPPGGVSVSFEELGQWSCNDATKVCETNGSVVMKPNDIADGKVFNVHVSGNNAVARALNCRLNNWARIIDPVGAPQNIQPADDLDHAAYNLPAELCQQPTNLNLAKYATQALCNVVGDKWRCLYDVVVKNAGPGTHSGPITVQDWVPAHPAGATMSFQGPWNCVGAGTSYDCTHPPVDLTPGQQVVLKVTVMVPAGYAQCKLQNMARIKAPLGAPWNTDATDDLASATEEFAPMAAGGQTYCHVPVPAQPCPPGFSWLGDRCGRGPVTVVPPRVCPQGMIGTYPDCRRPPVVVDPPRVCPPGMIGKPPHCRPIVRPCPKGTIGKWPNCRKVEPPKCPRGMVGQPPNCKPIVRPCPKGTIGKWPNCRKVEPPKCPRGTVGKPPNCRKIGKPSFGSQPLRQGTGPSRTGPSRPLPTTRAR